MSGRTFLTTSSAGLDHGLLPMRLWQKAGCLGIGEESVVIDLLPLIAAVEKARGASLAEIERGAPDGDPGK